MCLLMFQSLYDDKRKGKPPASIDSRARRRNSALQKDFFELSDSSQPLQRTASANYIKPNNELTNVIDPTKWIR